MSITLTPQDDGVRALVGQVDALLDKLTVAPFWQLSDGDSLALVTLLGRTTAKLAAVQLAAIHEIESRGTAVAAGAASTAAWVRTHTLQNAGSARRTVQLAQALHTRYAATGSALAAGSLAPEHADVIVRALDGLPGAVDDATREAAEQHLTSLATEHDPARLAQLARHLRYCLDPDGADALAAEEARLADSRELHLTPTGTGWWRLAATLDPDGGAELHALLDTLSGPRPARDGTPDPRTNAHRQADALTEIVRLARNAPEVPSSGGHRPVLLVTIPLATLIARPGHGPASWPNGAPMSAGTARRLACDAGLIPAVLDAEGQPLDLGRTTYSPPAWLRRAVLSRDNHRCAHPYCSAPPRHIHHIVHWADGGSTSLDNLTSLCGYHHRRIHQPASPWTVSPRSGGRPIFSRGQGP